MLSPKARTLAAKCLRCSSCPVNLTETSTVSPTIGHSAGRTHLLQSLTKCQQRNSKLYCFLSCWLVYKPQLVLNWVWGGICAASKYPVSLSLGVRCVNVLWWKRLLWDRHSHCSLHRRAPERFAIGCSLKANWVCNDQSITHQRRHPGRSRCLYTETFSLGVEIVWNCSEQRSETRKERKL